MLFVSLTEKIVAEKFTKLYIYIRFLITEATKMLKWAFVGSAKQFLTE